MFQEVHFNNFIMHYTRRFCWTNVIIVDCACLPDVLNSILSDYEVLPLSGLQMHSVRKRDIHTQSHLERLVSFTALDRYGN